MSTLRLQNRCSTSSWNNCLFECSLYIAIDFFLLEELLGQPLGHMSLFPEEPYLRLICFPQKIVSNWKLFELQELELSDCTTTGISNLTSSLAQLLLNITVFYCLTIFFTNTRTMNGTRFYIAVFSAPAIESQMTEYRLIGTSCLGP